MSQVPTGILTELIVSDSQFNSSVTGIYADTGASGFFGNLQVSHNLFLDNPIGIRLRNNGDYTITGNTFNGTNSATPPST
ncbi:MAG: hypothetical protein WBW81_14075 [Methylocella sp.]